MSETQKKPVRLVKDVGYTASLCCSGMQGTAYDERTKTFTCNKCGQGFQEAPASKPAVVAIVPSDEDREALLRALQEQARQDGDFSLVTEFLQANSGDSAQAAAA